MQSSILFAALSLTFFRQTFQFGATFNYIQWTSEKCLYRERISISRNCPWQAELFRHQVHEWTETLRKFNNIRLGIDLCPRRNLERHKYNNMDRETCPNICIHFFKPCGRTNYSLQLWSSSPACIFHCSSWKFSFPKQNESEKLVPWYQDNNKD